MTERGKRITGLVIVLMLLFSSACAQEEKELTEEDLSVLIGEQSFMIGCPAQPFLEAVEQMLQQTLEKTETESCMFAGMDKEYASENLLIGTHPSGKNGGDEWESLLVYDASLSSFRGIRVGMSREEVTLAYGENGVPDWDELRFTHPDTGASLIFVFDMETDEVICWMLLRNTDAA